MSIARGLVAFVVLEMALLPYRQPPREVWLVAADLLPQMQGEWKMASRGGSRAGLPASLFRASNGFDPGRHDDLQVQRARYGGVGGAGVGE